MKVLFLSNYLLHVLKTFIAFNFRTLASAKILRAKITCFTVNVRIALDVSEQFVSSALFLLYMYLHVVTPFLFKELSHRHLGSTVIVCDAISK